MKPESCFWNEKELVGGVQSKIREYLREGLIRPSPIPCVYFVNPAKGRHIVHEVNIEKHTCTCQKFVTKGEVCSHMMAVKLFLEQVDNKERVM